MARNDEQSAVSSSPMNQNSTPMPSDKSSQNPKLGFSSNYHNSKMPTFAKAIERYLPKKIIGHCTNILGSKENRTNENSLPVESLCDLRANRESILRLNDEQLSIYNHAKYGNELSDDDISILQPDHDKKFHRKYKECGNKGREKKDLVIKNRSISENECSSFIHQSTDVECNTVEYYNAGVDDIEKAPDAEHKPSSELFVETTQTHSYEGFFDRTKIPIKLRLKQRQEQVRELWKDHRWKNWCLLVFMVLFIIILCFVIPLSVKYACHNTPIVEVHERLSDYIYPQLSAIRTSLVDPDTPLAAHYRLSKDGDIWPLVFSDEFNANGRSFYSNMDQFWEAVDLNYAATEDLEWYDPDAITTNNGTLNIRMDAIEQHNLFYRSGMLQSWNKLCLTGGMLEISAKLPGSAYTGGLWPGLWVLGNLARAGYTATAEGVWPYTYNECDAGITANQSSADGISYLPGQKLNKCTCKGEDHPNPGTGRGAPEIDILEGAHSSELRSGVASQTLQIAPFDVWYVPDYSFVEVYNFSKSSISNFLGTPYQEMLSTETTINDYWFQNVVDPQMPNSNLPDKETFFQMYGIEYQSLNKNRRDDYCRFFIGQEPVSTIYGNSLHPNGNVGWRDMPREPMSIVLNLGISTAWSMIQWLNIVFPVEFQIDYVRLYQPKEAVDALTCDPEDYPTTDYIKKHQKAYINPNLTTWKMAGYDFPKNKLTGC